MKNSHEFRVLIVDDETAYLDVYEMLLGRKGYKTDRAGSGEEALDKLATQVYDLVLTDLIMGGMDGLALLAEIKKRHPNTEVIMITGYGSIESAVVAMKQGAFSYFIKSADPEILLGEIGKLAKLTRVKTKASQPERKDAASLFMLRSANPRIIRIMDMIHKIAVSNASVLITGESGVGKEVYAHQLHAQSPRRNQKFVAVNCQALSESLLESELFGHERGSFTGASERRIGRFEEADGGTLFLDEIGEMPVETQVKLLRVLETRKIERIGSNSPIPVDLRLVSATNRNIPAAIRAGRFREDLFYRINTIVLEIPPLRERKEDIPGLIDFFLARYLLEYNKTVSRMEREVGDFLRHYDYPGNIRELKNIIERLVVLSDDGVLRASDLPGSADAGKVAEDGLDTIKPLRDLRKEVEKKYIASVLGKYNGNITEAARHLCISRRQLFNKVVEYDLKF
ncbi:MAG TPA: sigma-54 dependent transcriptional regulator [Selenomonadales bacterium]|nr:sigma-54 dependent transcriptional regulator [Selenomonadales bacterium]